MKASPWAVAFLVYSFWPPSRSTLFLEPLLEAWNDYGFNKTDKMSSTLIGTKLDNDKNEMEKPEVDNVEEKQSSVLEQPKVDEV